MTLAPDDPLSAALAEIREALDSGDAGRWYEAGRRLLAAVDEVLALAGRYDAESERLWGQVRDADSRGVKSGLKPVDAAWNGDAAKAIREAVTSALTGKAADDAEG